MKYILSLMLVIMATGCSQEKTEQMGSESAQVQENTTTSPVVDKTAADKAAADKAAVDKAAVDKAAVDKAAVDKAAVDKAAADKAAVDKAAADKAAADKAAADKAAVTKPVAKVVAPLTQGKGPIRSEPKTAPNGMMLKESLGDAVAGEKVAKKCKSCHTFNQGGKKKVGPNLFGIVGKTRGTFPGFKYGSYLSSIGGNWDEASLRAWVADSKGVAKTAGKKAKMPSQKITGAKADDLIAYLKTLK